MKRLSRILFPVLILCALPATAYANMGTPLMWAGILHMFLGNAVIGIVEGLILAYVFRLKKPKAIFLLIVANYFSAWIGTVILGSAITKALRLDLYNAWPIFWMMVFYTYLATLVFEWPFVALAFWKTKNWFSKSLRASLVIQTISYIAIFGWYWIASGTSLYTKLHVVELSEIAGPDNIMVYFISEKDGDVYKRSLHGSEQKIFELGSTSQNDRLFLRENAADSERWDIVARMETEDRNNPDLVLIQEAFASQAVSSQGGSDEPSGMEDNTWFNFGPVPRLGPAEDSQWEFRTGFWAAEGLRATRNDGAHVNFAFETPFAAWYVRNATHLPSDKALFQLGRRQICLFDPETKQIALVTYGRGPVAVIAE